jgi:hypothetical protein
MMEALSSSETSVLTRATWRENLRSYKWMVNFTSRSLCPLTKNSFFPPWLVDWLGPIYGLDDTKKRKSLSLPGRLELGPFGRLYGSYLYSVSLRDWWQMYRPTWRRKPWVQVSRLRFYRSLWRQAAAWSTADTGSRCGVTGLHCSM